MGLIISLTTVFLGIGLVGGCSQKQTTIIQPEAIEEVKKNLERQDIAEKIAGYAHPEALISAYALNEIISAPDTLIIDTRGSTYRIYQNTYPKGHIPGATAILHSLYCHPNYPGRIAPPLQLQNTLGESGAGSNTKIILYGDQGLQTRLYWAIKMYGYDNVRILDGGLDNWQGSGYEISTTVSRPKRAVFEFDLTKLKADLMYATMRDVAAAAGNNNCVVIDARTSDEYAKGHIPGSVNIPWSSVFNKDMTFKPAPSLTSLFASKNVTQDKKIIVYCNNGVQCTMIWFTLSELLGYPDVKSYDGSFNEWQQNGKPVAQQSASSPQI
ncbi:MULTISPECIES: sulfurtransferase [Pelotomaculum]|uniref:sulfurtransferase n=1 Tax=Pelotomaculum TaxID=191373 RepID=UPI0010669EC4|nr:MULTISPECIES: sulfurtransferase [Pelotomaculum]